MPAGRLAVNTTDERLYFKNTAGAIVQPMVRPHTHPVADITNIASTYVAVTQKAAANGVASLGADTKVPLAQLPTSLTTVQVLPTTAHDLNTYVTTSNWYQTTDTGAAAGTNYPVPKSGFLQIIATGTPVMQVYTTRDGQQQFFRCQLSASNYSPWQEVQTVGAPSLLLPVTAHDLNTYTTTGQWYQGTASAALPAYNYPAQQLGFLSVQMYGTATLQVYTTRVEPTQMFWRTKTGATVWSLWQQVQTGGVTPTTTITAGVGLTGGGDLSADRTISMGTPGSLTGTTTNSATGTTHTHAVTLTAANVGALATGTRGAINGVASLDASGKIPLAQLPVVNPTQLTGQDLNTVVTTGQYYVNSDATATAALNYPIALAGILEVIVSTTGNQQVVQRFTTRSDNQLPSRVFIRNRFNGTSNWYAWYEIGVPKVATEVATSVTLGYAQVKAYTRMLSGATVTVPAGSLDIGAEYHFRQAGTGAITFVPASGVTINPPFGGTLVTAGQGATVTLKCVDLNVYDLFGQVAGA
jgi:hypothetical protein